jgi:hypothetical protein
MCQDIWISEDDLVAIRKAILEWNKPVSLAHDFYGCDLAKYYDAWQTFVEMDWKDWDVAEYHHDIGVRYWIQFVLEHSSSETRTRLEQAVSPLDALFRAKMHPCSYRGSASEGPFSERPYFWEINTIHPEECDYQG